ncbi:TetR/AcrR family transcriptional regulator [Gordonia sp. CPCC 205515]|uniref:TetR/AcrR family transcriptional regulator n=1 Tax=Gordonia sp. CPCC 205515 TaxID=3140791 RepID=UPI003AF38AE0
MTRRPRDRRQQIIASAARQFREFGYHNVGITGIAEAVGITSGALYRHFGGKQELLLATVENTLDQLQVAWSQPDATLDCLLDATCALASTGPQVGALWAREIAHLPEERQRELRGRLRTATEPLRAALAVQRPELSRDAVDLLIWAMMGVISSPAYYTARLEPSALHQCLLDACRAVVMTPQIEPGEQAADIADLPDVLLPASRREAILIAASRLFSARGFQAVGVDDIGAAAGITGATVYHHFPNKAAILSAAANRVVAAMMLDLSRALDSSQTAAEALDKVLRFYVRINVEHVREMRSLQNEAINLPEADRQLLGERRADFIAEWVALLTADRTDLSVDEAQAVVLAASTSISALMGIPHIRRRRDIGSELVLIGEAILGLRGAGDAPTA